MEENNIRKWKKKAIERAAREYHDQDISKAVAEYAEEIEFEGYEDMVKEGKCLF